MSRRLFGSLAVLFAFALLLPGQAWAQAALSITKADNGPFTVGTNGTYTIMVSNSGTSTTDVVTVTDTLPNGLTFIVGAGTNWTCSASGQLVTCTNPGTGAASIVNGSPSMIKLTVSVGVAAVAASPVSNTATVSGGGDGATGGPSNSDATTVLMTVKSGPAVYISTAGGQQILAVDGAVGTTAADFTYTLAANSSVTTVFNPSDAVVGPDKRIYICDPTNNQILRVRQDGTQFELVYAQNGNTTSLPGAPQGPSFKENDLYFNTAVMTNLGSQTGVWRIAGAAGVAFGGAFNAPAQVFDSTETGEGTAFNGSTLLAVEQSANEVLSCSPSSLPCTTIILIQNPVPCGGIEQPACVLDHPVGIAVRKSDGHIFVANRGSLKNVNEFDSSGNLQRTYASFAGNGPYFLALDALGRLYVVTAADDFTGGQVWRIDPPGGETNLVLLVALSTVENTNGVGSTDQAVGLGLGPNTSIPKGYSSGVKSNTFDFSTIVGAGLTDKVIISFNTASAFELTVFREEVPEALLSLQETIFPNPTPPPAVIPCAEYNSDQGTCVVYEEGIGSTLDPLTSGFSGVDYQLFYTPNPLVPTGVPVLAHAEDTNLQTPVDQYDENALTGFTLATSVDPGMDGGSGGGLSRHVALNTPQAQTGTTFCGIQSPAPPGRIFNPGQVIPVKFKIAASGGNCQTGPYVTNAVSQLWLFNTTTNKFVTPTSRTNTGNFFFANATTGQNSYNINTTNLPLGTYIFTITSNSSPAVFSNFVLQP